MGNRGTTLHAKACDIYVDKGDMIVLQALESLVSMQAGMLVHDL